MVLYLDSASSVVVYVYLGDSEVIISMGQDDRVFWMGVNYAGLSVQFVSVLSMEQCALCIVSYVLYMSVAAVSWQVYMYVALPTQDDHCYGI